MRPLTEMNALSIFEVVQYELVYLFRSLEPEEWEAPALSRTWSVKDIAAHLLDVDIRRLSLYRDGHRLPPPPDSTLHANTLKNGTISSKSRQALPELKVKQIRTLVITADPQVRD